MPSISEKRGQPSLCIDTAKTAKSSSVPMYRPDTSSPTTPYSPVPTTPTTPLIASPVPRFCESLSEEPREIIMGGLVTRLGPSSRRGSQDGEWDEKRIASIEVPGIVLTEPHPEPFPRATSPPPKSILLLPPTVLPLPDSSKSTFPHFSRWFTPSGHTSSAGHITSVIRSVVLLGAVGLGAWHLYSSLSHGGWAEEMSGLADEMAH